MWAGAQQHWLPEPAPGPSSTFRHPTQHYPQQLGQGDGCSRSVSTETPMGCVWSTAGVLGALRWEALLNKGTNIRQLCSGAEDQLPVSDVKNCPSLSYH